MAARKPVVLPETFSGGASWEDWIEHFERTAAVNEWTEDAVKLKWLQVRLTGRAATAYKRFATEVKNDYKRSKEVLQKRFEPDSKKEIYMMEFQTRKKLKGEDWATFGEDVRILAEKAYPGLQPEAQETLALNHYLTQVDNAQVAFGVRQKKPQTIDEAVQYTLELESYLPRTPAKPVRVSLVNQEEDSNIAAASLRRSDLFTQLLDRMDRLEANLKAMEQSRQSGQEAGTMVYQEKGGSSRQYKKSRSQTVVCHKCGKEGHFARGCASRATGRDMQTQGEGAQGGDTVPTLTVSSWSFCFLFCFF